MIIVIGTPTCLHCKVLDGHLETMDFGIRVAVKVDADKDPATAKQFNVTHYPTVILADDKGNITHRFVGSDAGPQLRKVLK